VSTEIWFSGLCCRVVLKLGNNVSEKSAGSMFDVEVMKMKAAGSCSGCPANVQPLYCFRLRSDILRQRKNDVTGVAMYCFEQLSLNSCRRAKEDRDNLRDDTWSPSSVPSTSGVYNTRIVCIPDRKHHHWVDVCTVHSYLACLLCWPTWMVGGAL